MFCTKCGNQITDGSSFCPSCGNNLNTSNVQISYRQRDIAQPIYNNYALNQRAQERTAEINEVRKMINYFSQKTDTYNQYDDVCNQLSRMPASYGAKKIVWGVILSVIGGFFLLEAFSALLSGGSNGATGFLALFILSLPFFGAGALLIVLHITGSKNYQNRMAILNESFDQLSTELMDYYNAYGYCPIGPEYTNPSNLVVILDTIQSGRANNVSEAINILVEDAHRNNMEAIARQTAVNTAAAARGARAGAIFSAANFFLK